VIQRLANFASTLPPEEARRESMAYINGLSPDQQWAIALRWFIDMPKGSAAALGGSPR
jgi:hypothetical protein